MNLRECFDRHGCDKGCRHGYERVYGPAFNDLRYKPIRLLEIGIYQGASLAAWVDFFPNAEIFGIDTFQRVQPEDIPILNHPRVKWRQHDSTTPGDFGQFDIIIDDGLHTHVSQRKTFDNFMPYAKMYFIEDVWAFSHMTEDEKMHRWPVRGYLHNEYSEEAYSRLFRSLSPYVLEFHDMRDGCRPDSFIIQAEHR